MCVAGEGGGFACGSPAALGQDTYCQTMGLFFYHGLLVTSQYTTIMAAVIGFRKAHEFGNVEPEISESVA